MQSHHDAIPTPDAPFGGYSLVSVREAGGEETVRFEAYVAKNGRRLFHVSNCGTGASHRYGGLGPHKTNEAAERGWRESQAAIREFDAFATEWNKGSEFAGWEDTDQLVNRLMEVAALNRMRRTPFLLDDQDYWRDGEAHTVPSSMGREALVEALRSPQFAGRNPRIWSSEVGDFVPVT